MQNIRPREYRFEEKSYTEQELILFLENYPIQSVLELQRRLEQVGYFLNSLFTLKVLITERLRTTALMLSGEPGAGKTSLAIALSKAYNVPLYRLECYRGITVEEALYRFNRKLQDIKLELLFRKNPNPSAKEIKETIYDYDCIEFGPLGKAYTDDIDDCFILINEIDKIPPEEGFEAVLLTYIDEYSFLIPELNIKIEATKKRKKPPLIIITSNAGKDNSSAASNFLDEIYVISYPLQRRTTHLFLPVPGPSKLFTILRSRLKTLDNEIIRQIIIYLYRVGASSFSYEKLPIVTKVTRWEKPPGTSEIIDFALALEFLHETYKHHAFPSHKLIPEFIAICIEKIAKTLSDQRSLLSSLTDDIREVYKCKWTPTI
ncbi:AAA family ATPase [Candidatus Dojkabacteria bacterium]|uniref:AAA family ATPase n=1 Tax=Candidatus Dojkabacteria bacterium TaxID=2099670 RepID=A0A3M0YX76_9BACT|nr:MAG: AAA family ATPase [Candidatus Dojkabacteria bacterium]